MSRTASEQRRAARGLLALTLAASLAAPVLAHNSAVVHPEITDVAMETLRGEDRIANGAPGPLTDPCDPCAFNDLWENRGTLLHPGSIDDDAGYVNAFNGGAYSIIIGSVIEDGNGGATIARPVNHFFHAITGIGHPYVVGYWNSSQVRAQEIFLYALRIHDYTVESQRRSYAYLGRFLHLIEDKGSPPHVHQDSHLGGDDWETRYVPGVWLSGGLRAKLTNPAPVSRNVTSASDIWPVPVAGVPEPGYSPPESSLAGYTFNRTSYWGNLQYPTDGTPPPPPTGELADMFPDDPTDPADDGLHWVSPTIGWDRWVIDGVGEYHYKQSWADEDEWWPDTAVNGRSTGNPNGVMALYYIEELMTGETADTSIVPDRIRQTYSQQWNPATNPVVQNAKCVGGTNPGAACSKQSDCAGGSCQGKSLTQLQTDNLLVPPVEFVAGAAKWWYRYANRPPVLMKVTATQNAQGSPAAKYLAEWRDETTTAPEVLDEAGVIPDTTENIERVTKRNFLHSPLERKYVNALADLTLRLEFNEPMREISELKLLDSSAGGEVKDLLAAAAGPPVKADTDKTWTYTFPAASLAGLNGELVLKVKARDKNEHVQDGDQLDATPGSPARRNLTGPIDLRSPNIPWHTQETNEDQAYDFASGDLNHRLLFDTTKPTTTITKTP